MNGLLSGKHYNRACQIHEPFAEALNRLFMEAHELNLPEDLCLRMMGNGNISQSASEILDDESFKKFAGKYNELRSRCLNGDFGKTQRFWVMYMDMVDIQLKYRLAVSTERFEMRTECWAEFLPMYFAMNKQNYARYGSYYYMMLLNLDTTHPGARDEMADYLAVSNADEMAVSNAEKSWLKISQIAL